MTFADLRAELAGWTRRDWLEFACGSLAVALALLVLPWAGWVLALVADLPASP